MQSLDFQHPRGHRSSLRLGPNPIWARPGLAFSYQIGRIAERSHFIHLMPDSIAGNNKLDFFRRR
jgi:hypothetical protein